jgi:hypothetical protein
MFGGNFASLMKNNDFLIKAMKDKLSEKLV